MEYFLKEYVSYYFLSSNPFRAALVCSIISFCLNAVRSFIYILFLLKQPLMKRPLSLSRNDLFLSFSFSLIKRPLSQTLSLLCSCSLFLLKQPLSHERTSLSRTTSVFLSFSLSLSRNDLSLRLSLSGSLSSRNDLTVSLHLSSPLKPNSFLALSALCLNFSTHSFNLCSLSFYML